VVDKNCSPDSGWFSKYNGCIGAAFFKDYSNREALQDQFQHQADGLVLLHAPGPVLLIKYT